MKKEESACIYSSPPSSSAAGGFASSGEEQSQFTVESFTQNLASVLSDPNRSRAEVSAFFTRHWGEQFVPRTGGIPPTPQLPRITLDHFRHYLSTTAKKHRQYLKARRALRNVLIRHSESSFIDADEVPAIFFRADFSLRNADIFSTVFLEPLPNETDSLISAAECRRASSTGGSVASATAPAPRPLGSTRPGSCASLTSVLSLQNQLPVEAAGGRFFRPQKALHNRLEFYHDTVGVLLNHQLESKSEEFWRTVHSYSALHGELESAIEKAHAIRKNLRQTDEQIYAKSQRIIELHYARENRRLLLQKLHDITCLRDAQTTVQMLLNQNNFPKALECIETAHDVLNTDLKGVICFRHLSSQLNEMQKAIGKMLQEEFISLIQREFGRPIERELEVAYQESQLHPVVLGLLRCREFRFVQVLRSEIVEAIKNSVRQIVRARIIECDAASTATNPLAGFDPSLGNLGVQITKMTLNEWVETLRSVFKCLYLLCCRVLSVQELFLEDLALVEQLNLPDRLGSVTPAVGSGLGGSAPPSRVSSRAGTVPLIDGDEDRNDAQKSRSGLTANPSFASLSVTTTASTVVANGHVADRREAETTRQAVAKSTVDVAEAMVIKEGKAAAALSVGGSASSQLALTCFDFRQLKAVIPLLVEHSIVSSEERACKLIIAKSKGEDFLDKCSPAIFHEVCTLVDAFVERTRTLLPGGIRHGGGDPLQSPLQSVMQQQITRFITKFHEQKRSKLGNILDSEQWRQIELPPIFQRLIDEYERRGALCDVPVCGDGGGDVDSGINVDDVALDGGVVGGGRPSEGISDAGLESNCSVSTAQANAMATGGKDFVVLNGEKYIVIGTSLLLLRILAQYCGLLQLFPQRVSELNLNVVEILKNFNSRTCQLILGAGALQLVGLKTISVKNLALSSRSLQLIAHFIPVIRREFAECIPPERAHTLRHFDHCLRDYNDHIDEINNKLLAVMDSHLISALNEWRVDEKTPTPCFQLVVKQIGKFYSGYSSIMPTHLSLEMLKRVHANFKLYFKQHLQARGITPHDSLTYGLAGQDYAYYVENLRSFHENFGDAFPDESLGAVLQPKKPPPPVIGNNNSNSNTDSMAGKTAEAENTPTTTATK